MMSKIGLLKASESYDVDAAAYFAAMSVQPDATRKNLINDLIVGLKTDGVWSLISWLSLLASHDDQSARLNAKDPAKLLSVVSTPTFTTDRGYAGNGSENRYLDSGEALDAAGIFSLNSAHVGVWVNTAGSSTSRFFAGAGGSRFAIVTNQDNTTTSGTINTSSSTQFSTASTAIGMTLMSRTGPTTTALYKNGASIATSASSSTLMPTGTGRVVGSGGSTNTNGRHAAFFWGSGLNATQQAAFYTRLNTYLTAIGAN